MCDIERDKHSLLLCSPLQLRFIQLAESIYFRSRHRVKSCGSKLDSDSAVHIFIRKESD